jgi:hypothetical protein
MTRTLSFLFAAIALLGLSHRIPGDRTAHAAAPAKVSCKGCHTDFASVLPKGHSAVKGAGLASCTPCHAPDRSGKAAKNPFSTRMHRAHVAPKGTLECTACHAWVPGKSFGLAGQKGSWGAPKREEMDLMKEIFASWTGSGYTDTLHAEAGIACSACHGKDLPTFDVKVENGVCLACHGPMEQLARKTEPKDFKDRNPHKSHLGDISCNVCHKGHQESTVYCLGCHKNFNMKIQGGTKTKP